MIHQTSDIILAIQPTPVPFDALRAELMGLHAGSAAGTRAKVDQVFRELVALGVETTDQLTPELVARFIASKPTRAPETVRGLLMTVRAIANYAEGRRYLAVSPFRVRKLHQYLGRVPRPAGRRHLPAADVRRLLDAMRADVDAKRGWARWRAHRLYAATSLVALTGVRKMEALTLWVEDIDLVNRTIDLTPRGPRPPAEGDPAPRLKTAASDQPIAMPAALVPILSDWLAHRLDHPEGFELPAFVPWVFPGSKRRCAWTTGGPGLRPIDRLKALGERAGIEHVTFSMLRKSWVTRADALGIPRAMSQRQCRHTTARTTEQWYAQRDLDDLRGAVEGFDF